MSPLERRVINQGRTDNPFDNFAIGVDKEADWPSLRTLGDGSQQAAPGNHLHVGGASEYLIKEANTPRASTTAFTADPDLAPITFPVSTKHEVEFYLSLSGSESGDWKGRLTGSAIDFISYGIRGMNAAGTGITNQTRFEQYEALSSVVATGLPGAGSIINITLFAVVFSAATGSPSISLEWAQLTSNATASVVRKGSRSKKTRMS